MKKSLKKAPAKKAKKAGSNDVNFEKDIAELQIILRALGEQAIMMRDGGKLAEKEKTYFGDIVTEADRLVERELAKHIRSWHPDHRVRGEEGTNEGDPESTYQWLIDPVDGNTNFSKGSDFFAISVGVTKNGKPVMGALYFPALARFIYAEKGKGAFENGNPFKLYERPHAEDLHHALVAGAISSRHDGRLPILDKIRLEGMNLVNTGAMTYNSLLVAERKMDASVHTDATPYDLAGVIPIIEETGGFVTGIGNDYPDFRNESIDVILASNKKLGNDIKKHLQQFWKQAED